MIQAAQSFQYSTGISRAQDAGNYLLWFRTLKPRIHEETDDGFTDEKRRLGPAQVDCEDLEFAYTSRPAAKVLQGLDVEVRTGLLAALSEANIMT